MVRWPMSDARAMEATRAGSKLVENSRPRSTRVRSWNSAAASFSLSVRACSRAGASPGGTRFSHPSRSRTTVSAMRCTRVRPSPPRAPFLARSFTSAKACGFGGLIGGALIADLRAKVIALDGQGDVHFAIGPTRVSVLDRIGCALLDREGPLLALYRSEPIRLRHLAGPLVDRPRGTWSRSEPRDEAGPRRKASRLAQEARDGFLFRPEDA
jgi:hypothetical protein